MCAVHNVGETLLRRRLAAPISDTGPSCRWGCAEVALPLVIFYFSQLIGALQRAHTVDVATTQGRSAGPQRY